MRRPQAAPRVRGYVRFNPPRCNYCNVNPVQYGQIWGMFETLQVEDGRLRVRLMSQFDQRGEKLMDGLKKHLRANRERTGLERLLHETGSPPQTKTLII